MKDIWQINICAHYFSWILFEWREMGGKLIDNPFARYCKNISLGSQNETLLCKCDFRINLKRCQEERIYSTAFKILIPLTFLIVIISISFLYYRVKIKGQSVFFPATRERGEIRFYKCSEESCNLWWLTYSVIRIDSSTSPRFVPHRCRSISF